MFGIHFGSPKPAAPAAATGATPPIAALPKAPPAQTRLSPWDKEHISATLAQISKGFTSSNNFFGGLAGAATNVAEQTDAWRKAALGTTEVGGPDSSFEIHTDQYGNRTYKPITQVQQYVKDKTDREERAKNAPKPADSENWLGDTAYAVEKLPPEQRPGAWQLMLQQGKALGYDVTQAPPEYSPSFNQVAISRTIGARQGSANAATAAYRAEQGRRADEGLALRTRNTNSVIAKRSAPPSTRRGGGGLPAGFIMDNH